MRYIFTDRFGGVSKPPFDTLNLALHVEDDFDAVLANRAILSQKIGTQNLQFMEQIHSSNVTIIKSYDDKAVLQTDAMITKQKDLALCVMVADCMPVLLHDGVKEVIAVAHAGRVGVKEKIVNKTIKKMREEFYCDINDIKIFIGASIKSCCYEVKRDVVHGFENYLEIREDKIYLDTSKKCLDDLVSIGIRIENIEISPVCTCCEKSLFSYRREGQTGRFCGAITI